MREVWVTRCTSCGKDIEPFNTSTAVSVEDEMSGTHCTDCNLRFIEAMSNEFPHGQCPVCGEAGRLITCSFGVDHIFFNHVESMCPYWNDGPVEEEGQCGMGCRPSNYTPDYNYLSQLDGFDLDNLPF